MEEQKQEKKKFQKWPIIVLVLLIVLVIGSTFAWFTLTKTSEKVNVIKSGSLSLILDDTTSDGILLEKAIPMSYQQGMKTKKYTFTLTNNGTTEAEYSLSLEDLEIDSNEERMNDSVVRYRLVKNGEELEQHDIYEIYFVEGNLKFVYDEGKNEFIALSLNGTNYEEGSSAATYYTNEYITKNNATNHEEVLAVIKNAYYPAGTYNVKKQLSAHDSILLSNTDNRVIDEGTIGKGETITYYLQVWIDSKAENEVMNQIFYSRLKIDAIQTGVKEKTPCEIERENRYKVQSKFKDDSWEEVVRCAKTEGYCGYQPGDIKTIDMGSLGKHKIRVANTSQCDPSLVNQGSCGLVLEFEDTFRSLPMFDYSRNYGGYPASNVLRKYVTETIYNALPEVLKNAIIDTTIVSAHGSLDTDNFITTEKIYLLSIAEIGFTNDAYSVTNVHDRKYNSKNVPKQLDYYRINFGEKYSDSHNYCVTTKYKNDIAVRWATRDAQEESDCKFFYINGGINIDIGDYAASPAFRLG